MLKGSAIGAAGWLLRDCLGSRALAGDMAAPPQSLTAKAKSVIQVWLWGGPPHLDTFDPKPEAGEAYSGPLRNPIATNVAGIRICELLPLLAKQADKYSLIRSMTHGNNGHETAAYMVQTGWPSGGRVVHPTLGAVVSLLKGYDAGYKGLIPPYVVLTQPQGRFSEAGFLPSRYRPFATGGNPAAARFEVEGIVAPGISDERQKSRQGLLGKLNTFENALGAGSEVAALDKAEKEAYDLILGDAGKVFDLSQEPDEVRDRYGRSTLGASCLVARRLVQRGVLYVTINAGGWDTHKDNFGAMRRMLPQLDMGLASLLADLSDLGLLDSTVVWCGGEFGRTPKVDADPPWNGGRGHHGKVFSTLVAGGGFKGGRAVGASDARGEEVKDRPVYPGDLIAAIYELLGINPATPLADPEGSQVPLTASAKDGAQTGGRLAEIL
jgi:hypothetical protein